MGPHEAAIKTIGDLMKRVDALEAQVAAADRLAGYAKHKGGCDIRYTYGSAMVRGKCDCGLDETLATYRAAKGE